MTTNRWRSIDAHFLDGAGRVWQSVMNIRQPKIPLWLSTIYRRYDFPRRMTSNRCRSINAHMHDGPGRVLQSVLEIQAAKIPLWLTKTYQRCDFPGRMTKHCWRSIDVYFAMAVSKICNHLIWHTPSFTVLWLPLWRFHLLSPWSLRWFLIIHRYI